MSDFTVPVSVRALSTALEAFATLILENAELRDQLADVDAAFEEDCEFCTDEPIPFDVVDAEVVDEPVIPGEPEAWGRYRDKDGDWWLHDVHGWRLIGHGADCFPPVIRMTASTWEDEAHLFAPFRFMDGGATEAATEAVRDTEFADTLSGNESDGFTLRDTAAILNRQGIDTGQNRLFEYLNTGIAWTDAEGTPRAIADGFLTLIEPANPSRRAVVRVTPEGVNELVRVMAKAV
ncbi:hypothetical protein KDJ57_gp67 [Gordonia phage Catfish]|uniref:Uncharacterized protein n=1 Tax=Gordonia phage Catfish TaxID=2301538 RepID=A0A385D0M5_9CAUD|nr:hypothetical protein KDJ57_gp67 [Gordonia phage Catfish]AXQ51878.1 hypothetical protein SEA_CATFISH_42 [Gordonia phage Catfish]